MGNLCSSPAADTDSCEDAVRAISATDRRKITSPKIISVSLGDPASPNLTKSESNASPMERALEAAKLALAKNEGVRLEDEYMVRKLIGHGSFAKVSICVSKKTGEELAVKSVNKNLEDGEKQRQGVIKEIAIISMLQDHPNSVRLHDVFEDKGKYHLVMDLCSGGELFDRIMEKGRFSEREAAEKMKALIDFLAYAHSKDIIHRDLKPENIMLSDKSQSAVLKVIDFGTSDFCKPGQRLQEKFGTPYYVAPEVLKRDYDKSADVWSAGVIMYILLSGSPPFGGRTEARILERVMAGTYQFCDEDWEAVTEAAKDMIDQMLVLDFSKRASAQALLQHRWFEVAATEPTAVLGAQMVKRLRAFAGMNRMKQLALVIIARTLTDQDVEKLRGLLASLDANIDGKINANDLHQALVKVSAAIDEQEMQSLFCSLDVDGTGEIEYEEFIAAMMDGSGVSCGPGACRSSFDELDKDGDGYITPEDLVQALPRGSSIELAREIVFEVDRTKSGKVDYENFMAMMQS